VSEAVIERDSVADGNGRVRQIAGADRLARVDIFRTPDERFEALPGYDFEPQYTEVDGLRLHRVDEGEGRPIVCFHGEPTWAYLYRKMVPPLRDAGNRVICPDYAGFGRSDKPTEIGWYSYDRHFELTSKQLGELDLADAVVIVQDWGGAIGLRWAVENAGKVGALVVLNTGLFTGRVSKGFMAWRDFAEKNPDLPVGFVIKGATATELPDEVVAAYEAPFPNAESKAGAAAFPLFVPTEEGKPGAKEMLEVANALGKWDKPALVAFSDGDPVFPYPKAGQRFVDLIPTAGEQVRIEGAAHFLQEDAGETIAAEVLSFLSKS
jgi:haloalkane dehalogenase